MTVKSAHKGLIGGFNPANLKYVDYTCGKVAPDGTKCHSDIVKNVKRTLMSTMNGVISSLLYEWNYTNVKNSNYSTISIEDDYGNKFVKIKDNGWIFDYFRKMCSMCHIGVKYPYGTTAHESGCLACHAEFNSNSKYLGDDPTIDKNKNGIVPYHELTIKIRSTQCLKCHNRSSRYGTSYAGIGENDFYPVPLNKGEFSKNRLLGRRFYFHFNSDVHYKKGMECIDCHTGKEIMGDGRLHHRMFEQTDVTCETCHGDYNHKPKTYKILSYSDPLLSISSYNLKYGDEIVVTKENTDFIWNVKKISNNYYLFGKVNKVKLRIPLIYKDKFHKPNPCNSKLECYSCHFSWTMLCFGCHTGFNKNRSQYDAMKRKKVKGYWYERRGYLRYSDIYLIKDQNNKYAPAQFCQSQVTIPQLNIKNHVFIHRDKSNSYVVAPVQPHTVTKASKRCVDCHNNPTAVGLGKGELFIKKGSIKFLSIYNSKESGLNVLFSPESMIFQSVADDRYKILNKREVKKILDVGKCTFCHHKYSEKFFKFYFKRFCPRKNKGEFLNDKGRN